MSAADSLSPDILANICGHFDEEYDRPTLYALARTCRAYSSVALRFLWRSLECPKALFLTLPEGSVIRREIPAPEGSYQWVLQPVRSSFSPNELERFYHYASFVEAVELSDYSFSECLDFLVSPELWQLVKPADTSPIFPHLRCVTCYERWSVLPQNGSPLQVFLVPKLEVLSLYFMGAEDESDTSDPSSPLSQLLASLSLESPRIRTLNLALDPHKDAQVNLAEAVRSLSRLTRFVLSGIFLSPAGLASLSSLPNLEYVEFKARASDFPPDSVANSSPLDYTNFPALQKLYLNADSIECALILLRWSVIDAPALTELVIRFPSTFSAPQFTSLTAAIADMRCRRTLDLLVIIVEEPKDPDNGPSPIALPPSAIAPLYILPAFTRLRIGGHAYLALDDASLADLARTWPRLTALSVCEECAGPPGVTLAGLHDLVQRCPGLREVGVSLADIDRATCERILSRPAPVLPSAPPLRTLYVGMASLRAEDVGTVAAVLSMLFPELDGIMDSLECSNSTRRRWRLVEEALRAFRTVRLQERKNALQRAVR